VLVFNERIAHSLRKELVTSGRTSLLAGTRFLTPLAVATAVLEAAEVEFNVDSGTLRVARIARALRQGLPLQHFRGSFLAETPGWDAAFARTLYDLETAALRPSDLRFSGASAQLLDVATVWEAVNALAGTSWSNVRVIAEAAALLASDPKRWGFEGPTLATLAPMFTAGEARLAKAIPDAKLALFAARPLRAAFLERAEALLGGEAARALQGTPLDPHAAQAASQPTATERDVLVAGFLDTPEALARPDRPRSKGADGTVHLEEHAGVEAEVEAAADWVARQILEHKTPLDQIAVLVARSDPLAGLIARRIGRLGAGLSGGPVPVFVAGGLPSSSSTAGARVLALMRALEEHLPAERVAEVLPTFRPAEPDARRLSRGRALALAYALGTAGGSAAHPPGALAWGDRAAQRAAQLAKELADARAGGAAPSLEDASSLRALERLLRDLETAGPALQALTRLAGRVLDDAPLSELWLGVEAFITTWMLLPVDESGATLQPLIVAARERSLSEGDLDDLRGAAALRRIADDIAALRLTGPRFGDPAIYVGSIRSAAGLSFDAVRVVGLAEGHWPSVSREDAVLPNGLREQVPQPGLQTTTAQSLAQLHALDMVVKGARRAVVFSMARTDVDRSQREPSPLFLEVAAALGRPGPAGEAPPTVPDLRVLRRDGFAPARAYADAFRRAWPVTLSAWQTRVARHRLAPHSVWFGEPLLDLDRIAERAAGGGAAADEGLLGPRAPLEVPGLTAKDPISASALYGLLRCPHKFMLERILGWYEPAAASPQRELDPMEYGTLFHAAAEDFFRQHADGFSERSGSLDHWLAEADEVAEAQLSSLLETYPLLGETVRAHELARLRRDLRRFLEDEWKAAVPSRFLLAEHPFGWGEPSPVDLGKTTLFVRGRIDRIDVEGRRLMVRDLKTGRAHPRRGKECEPDPMLDLQIGLYALVVKAMAKERKLDVGAAYVYTGLHPDRERAFREDIATLETATLGWLRTAEGILRERAFIRSPSQDDCSFCPFAPVCGDDFRPHVAELLESKQRGPLRALRILKLGDAE